MSPDHAWPPPRRGIAIARGIQVRPARREPGLSAPRMALYRAFIRAVFPGA